MSETNFVELLISFSGFAYFFLWSASFYGPIFTLYKEKTAMGVDSNYIFTNIAGYSFYAVYNFYGFAQKYNSQTGNVFFGDILFSTHLGFYFYYPHKIQLNKYTQIYTYCGWTLFIIYGLLFMFFGLNIKIFEFQFGYIRMLGYLNTISALLKHPPQIYYNFLRKSTKGWNINSRILDFGGGFFSFLQLFLKSLIDQNFRFNWAKFFLAVLSMIYDTIYMIQHFILYKNNRSLIDVRNAHKDQNNLNNNVKFNQNSEPDIQIQMILLPSSLQQKSAKKSSFGNE